MTVQLFLRERFRDPPTCLIELPMIGRDWRISRDSSQLILVRRVAVDPRAPSSMSFCFARMNQPQHCAGVGVQEQRRERSSCCSLVQTPLVFQKEKY